MMFSKKINFQFRVRGPRNQNKKKAKEDNNVALPPTIATATAAVPASAIPTTLVTVHKNNPDPSNSSIGTEIIEMTSTLGDPNQSILTTEVVPPPTAAALATRNAAMNTASEVFPVEDAVRVEEAMRQSLPKYDNDDGESHHHQQHHHQYHHQQMLHEDNQESLQVETHESISPRHHEHHQLEQINPEFHDHAAKCPIEQPISPSSQPLQSPHQQQAAISSFIR